VTTWMLDGMMQLSVNHTEHAQMVMQVCPLAEHARFATSSLDGTVKLWNAELGKCTATLVSQDPSAAHLRLLSDGRLLTASSSGLVRLWDADASSSSREIKVATRRLVGACESAS
jgi:WD40 repeat protein